MGRWAQAERRVRSVFRNGDAVVVGTPLMVYGEDIEVEWNALFSPQMWEAEAWEDSSPESTLRGANIAGTERQWFTGIVPESGQVWRCHVRGWINGRPGPWSSEGYIEI